MNADESPNVPPSATMCASEPRAEHELSEEALLRHEAECSRAAVVRLLSQMRANVGQNIAPEQWAGSHPWISTAVAAVTGFAVASAVVPAPHERATDKWARLVRHLTPRPVPQSKAQRSAPKAPTAGTTSNTLGTAIFDLARVAVSNFLAAMIQAQSVASAVDERARQAASAREPAPPGAASSPSVSAPR
jgi:hypothetical protein